MTFEKPPKNFEKSLSEKQIELKEKALDRFINFRNNYLDDLPEERVMPKHSHDMSHTKYKCRGNFFVGIMAQIASLIDKGVITNPIVVQKGQEFIDYVANRDFSKFSTQDDIDKVNGILDYFINELS